MTQNTEKITPADPSGLRGPKPMTTQVTQDRRRAQFSDERQPVDYHGNGLPIDAIDAREDNTLNFTFPDSEGSKSNTPLLPDKYSNPSVVSDVNDDSLPLASRTSTAADEVKPDLNNTPPAALEENTAPNQPPVKHNVPAMGANRSPIALIADLVAHPEIFHSPAGETFISFHESGHTVTMPIQSSMFRARIMTRQYERTGNLNNKDQVDKAIELLQAYALLDSPQVDVFTRVGYRDNKVYLDLCSPDWSVIEISKDGYQILEDSPVKFCRNNGMLELPRPQLGGGDVGLLRPLVNGFDPSVWSLIVMSLLGWLMPRGAYPITVVVGEQGAIKTGTCLRMRNLIDPNASPLRAMPHNIRDLLIGASFNHVMGFDNLSQIQSWLSDALCRLSTGGGFSTRTLYSNREETVFEARRPVIINGIDDVVIRDDLRDRMVQLYMPNLEPAMRRPEGLVEAEYHRARPIILGGLLQAASTALSRLPEVRIDDLPRMADFAMWIEAAESALPFTKGSLLAAYRQNRAYATTISLESDSVCAAIELLMSRCPGSWEGTASDLYVALSSQTLAHARKPEDWPVSAKWLSQRLRRVAPQLRSGLGIDIQFRHGKKRMISIQRNPSVAN